MSKTSCRYLILALAVAPLAAQADNDAVTARVGTLGLGVEYSLGFSENTQLRFGINSATYSFTTTKSDVRYNFDSVLKSGDLLLNWRPTGGKFFTTVGALYNRNRYDASARNSSAVTVGNNPYPAGTNLKGEVTFKTFAPYFGAGWGSPTSAKGFAWLFDLGVVYRGEPKVKLRSNVISQNDLNIEQADLQESIKSYRYYPHIGFSFGTRF